MANNKILNTRMQLKYDTFAAWTAADPVLLAGEIAVVVVPAASKAIVQEPAILIKVGDGTSKFSTLPWTSAIAADVHDWAKAANKPAYTASELTGLDDYIAKYVNEQMGISVDTDTVYKVEANADGMGFVMKSKAAKAGEDAWAQVAAVDFSAKFVKAIASGSVNGTIAVDGVDVAVKGLGSAAYTEASAYDVAGAAAAIDVKLAAEVTRATEAEAKALTDAKAYTDAKIIEKAYDDTAVRKLISDETARAQAAEKVNSDAIAVLNGSGDGSVSKQITDAFNEFATNVSDDGVVNSYKELVDYAATHGAEFTELVGDVAANAGAIADEKARAEGAEGALGTRVTTLENYDHAADIQTAKDWAKSYADGLATNYDAAGAAATAKSEAITDAGAKLAQAKTELTTAIDTKVDKVEGMGLSQNSFTNEDAAKLLNIESGAEVNVIETIMVNGVALPVNDKTVNVEVVHNINDLEQDAGTYVIFNCGSATVNI